MYLVRLDLALGTSLDTEEIDGEEFPSEGRGSLGLSVEF